MLPTHLFISHLFICKYFTLFFVTIFCRRKAFIAYVLLLFVSPPTLNTILSYLILSHNISTMPVMLILSRYDVGGLGLYVLYFWIYWANWDRQGQWQWDEGWNSHPTWAQPGIKRRTQWLEAQRTTTEHPDGQYRYVGLIWNGI